MTHTKSVSVLLYCGQINVRAPSAGALNRLDSVTLFLTLPEGHGVVG